MGTPPIISLKEATLRNLTLLALIILLAMTTGATAQESTSWVCPEEFAGQQLNVLNWTTYIAEDTIPYFEAACGVSVTYDNFASNEELLARLRTGNPGYDVIFPSDSFVPVFIDEGLLLPLNHANIPNLENLSPALLDLAYDPGNTYTLPYQWGTMGIGYNVDRVQAVLGEDATITSWQDMFDYPERRVIWIDDRVPMLAAMLNLLGYDPSSTDPDELAEAVELLVNSSANVLRIAQDDGQEALARGEADIVVDYSGDIFQIMFECEEDPNCTTTYDYVIPAEGTNIWADVMAIPVGAQNQALAEVFINYLLDPQVGADISNYTAYASPNQAAIELGLIDEALLENTAIYPDAALIERLFFIFKDPDVQDLYNQAWEELLIRIR